MKKLYENTLIILIAVLFLLSFSACSSEQDEDVDKMYTVTFVCDGYENITRTVKHGNVFSDIPTPPTIDGFSVAWQTYDFTKPITQNVIINAVKTPNTYTIKFKLDMKTATISLSQMQVVYGEEYTLPKANCKGYNFICWKIEETNTYFAEAGKFTFLTGFTLVAEWEVDETSSDNWSDGH